jgi:hypothetical protein
MKTATVQRTQVILHPDRTRVLLRPFLLPNDPRAPRICAQVMALSETEVHTLWQQVKREFGERHAKTRDFLKTRFEQVRACLRANQKLSEERQLLLGAYFSHEYSLEAAALFNPSIVPHPDQTGLPPGALRDANAVRLRDARGNAATLELGQRRHICSLRRSEMLDELVSPANAQALDARQCDPE